jgi:hypothetical protein
MNTTQVSDSYQQIIKQTLCLGTTGVTAALHACWPRCTMWSDRMVRSLGIRWVLLLLEEELEGLDTLLDRSALRGFVKRLVLLFDVVFVLIVDVNIRTLYICKTFLLLDCDDNTLQ